MKQIKITATVYDAGEPKYLAGQVYPITADTERQLILGNGTEVDVLSDDELAAKADAEAEPTKSEPAADQAAAPAAPAGRRAR